MQYKQNPIAQERYSQNWWSGNETTFWKKFGVSMEGKRRGEGTAPYLIMETFNLWDNRKMVLDAACGRAHLAYFLNEYGCNILGLDFSDYAIENSVLKGRVIKGEVTKLPFQDNYFELVISRECMEHLTIEQADLAFAEMVRTTKKYIYMTIWLNFDKNASDDIVLDDFKNDPTHISFCTRNFWMKRFQKYIDNGIIVERKDLESKLDWRGLGRVFVFERING